MAKAPKHGDVKTETHHHYVHPKKSKGEWVLEIGLFVLLLLTLFATGTAAYFTRQQYVVTDDQEKRQLRAYVGFIPGDIENLGDPEKQIWNAARKNYGQTPAYDVALVSFGQSIIHPGESIPRDPPAPPPEIRGAVTLFPTASLPLRIIKVGPKDRLADFMKTDGLQFVYFGTMQYHDVFDRLHFTYFCFMYTRDKPMGKDADGCLGHNDSN